jgi:hypothetical protein
VWWLGYRLDDLRFDSQKEKKKFLISICPDRLWGPLSLLLNEQPGKEAHHPTASSANMPID